MLHLKPGSRCFRNHCALYAGPGCNQTLPPLDEWYLKRGCVGVTLQCLQISYSHFSPLPHAAQSIMRCFSPFPPEIKYLFWLFFFFRCCCTSVVNQVTDCLVFPGSELDIPNTLRQGKGLLLHRTGFLF